MMMEELKENALVKSIIARHIQKEINSLRTIRYGEKMGPVEFFEKSKIVSEGSAQNLLDTLELMGYKIKR